MKINQIVYDVRTKKEVIKTIEITDEEFSKKVKEQKANKIQQELKGLDEMINEITNKKNKLREELNQL